MLAGHRVEASQHRENDGVSSRERAKAEVKFIRASAYTSCHISLTVVVYLHTPFTCRLDLRERCEVYLSCVSGGNRR